MRGGATNIKPLSRFYLSDKHLAANKLNLPLSFSYELTSDDMYPVYIWSISALSISSAISPFSFENRYSAILVGLHSIGIFSFTRAPSFLESYSFEDVLLSS